MATVVFCVVDTNPKKNYFGFTTTVGSGRLWKTVLQADLDALVRGTVPTYPDPSIIKQK
jgi:hypothetical protein